MRPDTRVAAEDRGMRINGHVIFDVGMALTAFDGETGTINLE